MPSLFSLLLPFLLIFFLLPFGILGEKDQGRGKEKKEEAAAAVAAAGEEACRDEVAVDQLVVIKSAKEKGKMPSEYNWIAH